MNDDYFTAFLSWSVRKIGASTLLFLGLLITAIGSLIAVLIEMVPALDATPLWISGILAVLLGWILAHPRIRKWLALMLGIGIGLAYTIIYAGNLWAPLRQLTIVLNNFMIRFVYWGPRPDLPDSTYFIYILNEISSRTAVLIGRTFEWLYRLIVGPAAVDPVAVVIVWSLILWLVSFWAAWSVRSLGRPLVGLLPAGILLGASLSYTRESFFYLLPFLAAVFFLLAQNSYFLNLKRWHANRVDYSEDLSMDLGLMVVPVVIGVLIVASLAPSFSIRRIVDFAERMTSRPAAGQENGDPRAGSPGLNPPPAPQTQDTLGQMRIAGLPRDHLLGSGPELSERVVMIVQTGDLPPRSPELAGDANAPHYYWRAITYDRYSGRGWLTGPTQTTTFNAGQFALAGEPVQISEQLAPQIAPGQRIVRQSVRAVGDLGGLVFAAGEILTVDHPYEVEWRALPVLQADSVYTTADIFGAKVGEPEFLVRSLWPTPSGDQLRQSGADYPQWVLTNFLRLPENLPNRVRNLAYELTATEATPYDRALAIERYLRAYPYNLDIPKPPVNRDVVDYFLFELKQGYCDYYATAMVILARAAGLPARLAIGYASGNYDANSARYVVTEANAHSWPEIFFPDYGWVAFEPTGGLPALERPDEAASPEFPNPQLEDQPLNAFRRDFLPLILGILAGFGILAAVAVAGWSLIDLWRLSAMAPGQATAQLYRRLQLAAGRMQLGTQPGVTPHELTGALSDRVQAIATGRRWEKFLQPAKDEAQRICRGYERSAYSPHPPDSDELQVAIRKWSRLRWRLWLAALLHKPDDPSVR